MNPLDTYLKEFRGGLQTDGVFGHRRFDRL